MTPSNCDQSASTEPNSFPTFTYTSPSHPSVLAVCPEYRTTIISPRLKKIYRTYGRDTLQVAIDLIKIMQNLLQALNQPPPRINVRFRGSVIFPLTFFLKNLKKKGRSQRFDHLVDSLTWVMAAMSPSRCCSNRDFSLELLVSAVPPGGRNADGLEVDMIETSDLMDREDTNSRFWLVIVPTVKRG